MKALVLLMILPTLMLIGCGEMQSTETTADNALAGLIDNNAITEEEANAVSETLSDESLELTEVSDTAIMMKIGGVDFLVDFVENLSGAPEEVAMIIDGIEVTTEVASDPQSLQGLIASLVTSKLEGKEVFGLPLTDLVDAGLGLITGDTEKADVSNLFGTLIRGALNMFVNDSPIGGIIGALAGPLLGGIAGDNGGDAGNSSDGGNSNNGNNNSNNNSNNSNEGGGLLGTIVNTVGGLLGGSGGSPLGGLFSLITNLFK